MCALRKIGKCIGNILFVLSVVLLILITLVVLMIQNGSDGRMMFGNHSFARVLTGSMEPKIPTGSFILVERVDPNALEVGDAISFWSDDPKVPQGFPVVHEIVQMDKTTYSEAVFITKGVANEFADEYPVYADRIVGRVVWQSSFLGYIIGMAQAPYMFPILIGILVICLIVNIISVVKEAKAVSDRSNEIAVAEAREEALRELQEADQHSAEDDAEKS